MRTVTKFATMAVFLLAFASPTEAQGILGRIKKRATEAVEKKAEDKAVEKIDQMMQKKINDSFDAIFGDSANPAPEPGRPDAAAPSGGSSAGSSSGSVGGSAAAGSAPRSARFPFSLGNAKTENAYTFDVTTTMEIESFERGASKGRSVVQMYYNSKEPISGTAIREANGKKPESDAFIILDAKNEAMVMLMTDDKGKKASIAYGWHDAAKFADSAAATRREESERVNWDTVTAWRGFTKLGTKTIAGYRADGYRGQSDEGTVDLWMTRDPRLASGWMFGASSNIKQMRGTLPPDFPEGTLLEMTSEKPSTGEKVTLRVTHIDTNARTSYAMSDYPRVTLGKE